MKIILEDWEYSIDELNEFKDLNDLAHLVVKKVELIIPKSLVHFYIYSKQLKEYREEDKENQISIPENIPLITYLALKNKIIERKSFNTEPFLKDDEIAKFFLIDQLNINILIPLVYRYRLLGFIGVANTKKLTKDQRRILRVLVSETVHNLNAALLVEQRFAALEGLDDIGNDFSSFDGIDKICTNLFIKLGFILDFKIGLLYLYEEGKLKLRAFKGISEKLVLSELKRGESISGYVANNKKPLLIKKLKDNIHYFDLNKEKYLKGSVLSVPIRTKEHLVGVLTLKNKEGMGEFTTEHLHLVSIFVTFLSTAIEKIRLYDSLENSYLSTIRALANALDAKDSYTNGHSTRVMQYSVAIAEEMEMPIEKINAVRYAALLHDIGKIGINENIIRKQDSLTDEEFEIMKQHPVIGDKILSSIDFLTEARTFIRYHHERVDGNGYFGLKDVPLEAQIINVADSFDAMNSDRSYRKSLGPVVAAKRLLEASGKQFGSKVVNAFISYLIKEKYISKKDIE